jgi:hypothetical protein
VSTVHLSNTERLPRWANVRVTLGDNTTRIGHVLVDHGDTVTVEYKSPAGHFQCRRFQRAGIELLPTTLCGEFYQGTRNRICAAGLGHVGEHNWVIRTVRED